MKLRVLVIGEGTSDLPLIEITKRLAIQEGASAVEGSAAFLGHDPIERLRAAARYDPAAQPYIAHRDSDRAGPELRRKEVADAAGAAGLDGRIVPCVTVRMTEAWLLTDADEIRRVVGNPRGRAPLELPDRARLEHVGDPKAVLRAALIAATESTGRRRKDAEQSFNAWRRILLETLDPEGPVADLPSFRRFREELREAIHRLASPPGASGGVWPNPSEVPPP